MISNEILDKFKQLYQEKFGVILTDEEATQMATDLVNLMRVLLKPDPEPASKEPDLKERSENETIRTLQYQ